MTSVVSGEKWAKDLGIELEGQSIANPCRNRTHLRNTEYKEVGGLRNPIEIMRPSEEEVDAELHEMARRLGFQRRQNPRKKAKKSTPFDDEMVSVLETKPTPIKEVRKRARDTQKRAAAPKHERPLIVPLPARDRALVAAGEMDQADQRIRTIEGRLWDIDSADVLEWVRGDFLDPKHSDIWDHPSYDDFAVAYIRDTNLMYDDENLYVIQTVYDSLAESARKVGKLKKTPVGFADIAREL